MKGLAKIGLVAGMLALAASEAGAGAAMGMSVEHARSRSLGELVLVAGLSDGNDGSPAGVDAPPAEEPGQKAPAPGAASLCGLAALAALRRGRQS